MKPSFNQKRNASPKDADLIGAATVTSCGSTVHVSEALPVVTLRGGLADISRRAQAPRCAIERFNGSIDSDRLKPILRGRSVTDHAYVCDPAEGSAAGVARRPGCAVPVGLCGGSLMARISYVDPATIDDPEIRAFIEEAERVGTPRPEIQLIRAHVPAVIRSFVYTWQAVFKGGIVDHGLKELLRLRVATSLDCAY